jgi:hypothetical protein
LRLDPAPKQPAVRGMGNSQAEAIEGEGNDAELMRTTISADGT